LIARCRPKGDSIRKCFSASRSASDEDNYDRDEDTYDPVDDDPMDGEPESGFTSAGWG
jgi:hypothetical protein